MEPLLQLDRDAFLWLNALHTPWADTLMAFATHRYSWLPLYALIIYFIFKYQPKPWLTLALVIAAVGLSDFTASGVLKPWVQRLRPCHEPLLAPLTHLIVGCGGKYGFASSHAANSAALATIFAGIFTNFSKFKILLVIWAIVVAYSRIYVGVHYPLDILAGMGIGVFYGFLFKTLYLKQLNSKTL